MEYPKTKMSGMHMKGIHIHGAITLEKGKRDKSTLLCPFSLSLKHFLHMESTLTINLQSTLSYLI